MLVKIVSEICAEYGIKLEKYSFDWILQLKKDEKTARIFGYQFENNTATACLICTDKSASSELLQAANIPVVEHLFFTSPENFKYIGAKGNWQKISQLLSQHGRLVVKPNEGTGGEDVFRVSTSAELEAAVTAVFSRHSSLAISPYYEIEKEYRVILLNGTALLIYSKEIPMLTGDGLSSVWQLILGQHQLKVPFTALSIEEQEELMKIPQAGERIPYGWKHNLGLGASPQIVQDQDLAENLSQLALQAAQVVNVNFASVDIVLTRGEYRVLEINSGIMMEHFAEISPDHYQTAKAIYQKAIFSMMGIGQQ